MSKLMVRKLLVSLGLAILTALVLMGVIVSGITGLALADGTALSFGAIASHSGLMILCALVFVLGFVVTLVSSLLVPSRRRRYRSSGTAVEEDVDDGRERGVVKWFNIKKGFGFIAWDEGEDVFVHFRSIRGQGHRSLEEGQKVKFTVIQGDKGPQADDVSAVR